MSVKRPKFMQGSRGSVVWGVMWGFNVGLAVELLIISPDVSRLLWLALNVTLAWSIVGDALKVGKCVDDMREIINRKEAK